MYILKVCHTCDSILGELEIDNLDGNFYDAAVDIIGNVAYTICPDCLQQMSFEPALMLH